MPVQYQHARPGYMFVPTKKGETESRINAKYKDTYRAKKTYRYCVPKRWILEGWVNEVKEFT